MTRAAIKRGEVREDVNAEALAMVMLGVIEGIEVQWLIDPSLDWESATSVLRDVLALAT